MIGSEGSQILLLPVPLADFIGCTVLFVTSLDLRATSCAFPKRSDLFGNSAVTEPEIFNSIIQLQLIGPACQLPTAPLRPRHQPAAASRQPEAGVPRNFQAFQGFDWRFYDRVGWMILLTEEAMLVPTLLSCLPALDPAPGDATAIIETPKGSQNKYDYDDTYAAFRLAGVMPQGSSFPYDFGFVPSTLGEDGDPFDVLVFMDAPVPVGCVLTIRLIGVIEAKQRQKGGSWIRNDRLLAVATHAHTHAHIDTLEDLRPRLLDEIEAFFDGRGCWRFSCAEQKRGGCKSRMNVPSPSKR
jgi:inorganic pyrophosphatase